MGKRKPKGMAEAERRFVKAVTEHLVSLGAKPGRERFGVLGLPYDLVLETAAGLLGISVHEDWVACRFRDVERAKTFLITENLPRCNPYSGKWNHRFFPDCPEDLSPGIVIPYLENLFRPLIQKACGVL